MSLRTTICVLGCMGRRSWVAGLLGVGAVPKAGSGGSGPARPDIGDVERVAAAGDDPVPAPARALAGLSVDREDWRRRRRIVVVEPGRAAEGEGHRLGHRVAVDI